MTTTVFVNGVTLTDAGWFNDVDQITYDSDGADFIDYTPPGTGAVTRSVQTTLRRLSLSPKDFGAVGDDATDDAAAIQRAIDYAGTVSGRRSGIEVVIDGTYAIGSTILIRQKSIRFRGIGWGQEGAASPNSYLRWIGAAGSPMLRVEDVLGGCRVSDLRLIGNTTNKPSAAISYYQTSAIVQSFNVFENLDIGDGLSGETSAGTGLTNGIYIEGSSSGNNAETLWQNLRIKNCSDTGFRVAGVQNSEHVIVRATIAQCDKAVQASSRLYFFGLGCTQSTTADIYIPFTDEFSATPEAFIAIDGFFSEGSARLAEIINPGRIVIQNGIYQFGAFTNADGKFIKAENNGDQHIELRNFKFQTSTAPTTTPFISMKSNLGGGGSRDLILDGIRSMPAGGPNSNGVDVTTQATTDRKYVYFRELMSGSGASTTATRVAEQFMVGFASLNFDPSRHDISSNSTSAAMQSISPTQITADQNDYNPSNAGLWRLTSDAARNITGIARSYPGRLIIVINAGAQNIVLQNQNASSTATNRIITGTAADVTLAADDTAILWYDWDTGRWRILNTH